MKHVSLIRGHYTARMTVPLELRAIIGMRELREVLGGDKKDAERSAHGVIAGFHAKLDDAREQLHANAPKINTVARQHYAAELADDDAFRARFEDIVADLPGEPVDTLPFWARDLRRIASGDMEQEEAEALLGPVANRWQKRVPVHGLSRVELLKLVAAVELDVAAAIEVRNKGGITIPEPKSPILNAPDPEPAAPVRKDRGKGALMSTVLEAFHRERMAGGRTLAEKTMAEHKVAVRMFDEFTGQPVPVRSITRADMLAYKQALLQTPNRYSLRFRGLTLPQAIKANEKRQEPFPTLDPQTINMKWLSHISTILKWATNNGYLEVNPAVGVRVDEGKGYKEPTRVEFSPHDLKAIFGHDLFKRPAEYASRQWALLLALYTGARSSSEIARVKLADIYEEQGIAVVHLVEASKNVRSKRIVPIHSALINLGFLTYVETLRRKGQERLFPDWEPEDKINRWFLRSYKPLVGINDSRKVFHSFRHTLKTALARHAVNRDVSDLITGHKDQSVGGIYIGDQAVTMIQAMHDGLNRVAFDLPAHNKN